MIELYLREYLRVVVNVQKREPISNVKGFFYGDIKDYVTIWKD